MLFTTDVLLVRIEYMFQSTIKKRLIKLEDAYSVEFLITTQENSNILLIHKDIYAFTLNITNCSQLTATQLTKINYIISNRFPNSFVILTKFKRFLWLSRLNTPIFNLSEYDDRESPEDPATITLQGRSWDDHCLKIINLEQNYRWELNQNYNEHLMYT